MPRKEQLKRLHAMQNRLRRYDVFRWVRDFMQHLHQCPEEHERHITRLSEAGRKKIVQRFRKAARRLLLFDYDGTLVPIVKHYSEAAPGTGLLELLAGLTADSRTELVIVTGRDRTTIRNWIKVKNCGFIAEHGAWIMEKGGTWKNLKPVSAEWKEQILPILETYCDRLPGSFIEEKEFSLTWHFRSAEPELGMLRAKELTDYLINFTANQDLQILQGKKIVETRLAGINKGEAVRNWLQSRKYDFILAAGDDWTDEDLFRALPKKAFSIKVGLAASLARFNVVNYAEITGLLQELLDVQQAG